MADVQHGVGLFVEQPLAVVLSRKALGEPSRQTPGLPAVQMQERLLRYVLAQAVPVERGLATDMQAFKPALQKQQAGMQLHGVVRAAEDPACQALEPTAAHVVHS